MKDHQILDYKSEFLSFDFETNPSWRIFKIMSEFVDGFTFLSKYDKTVSFFGSARFDEKNHHYHEAQELARRLAKTNMTIITGGGTGIMEAANRGAIEGNGESVGLNIELKNQQRINPYVQESIAFDHFFTRKVMLSFAAQAYVFFPGGFGTLDEFFEIVTLIQTKKIKRVPIILIGADYWSSLLDWIYNMVYKRHNAVEEIDLNIFKLVQNIDEAFEIIQKSVTTS
ncbi:MAG: hypothetical protein UR93_C0010G0007 [Berkelbacteria bacterium GW2011_GWA2_35_9]|uniref:Cytokinin riboside 5'-monophosphate phosphoribohydrolase n=1 Tax=Berkelbacteria bacterium GW2011_GWA2_35_9 TaxID=1618333 RepID=A0A0G0DIP1_9BACT|nr:MAG: hypothetical protein UR93_C0010G0007 [Berkelbacteria bacterium GW2011_GWA2_35_9]